MSDEKERAPILHRRGINTYESGVENVRSNYARLSKQMMYEYHILVEQEIGTLEFYSTHRHTRTLCARCFSSASSFACFVCDST